MSNMEQALKQKIKELTEALRQSENTLRIQKEVEDSLRRQVESDEPEKPTTFIGLETTLVEFLETRETRQRQEQKSSPPATRQIDHESESEWYVCDQFHDCAKADCKSTSFPLPHQIKPFDRKVSGVIHAHMRAIHNRVPFIHYRLDDQFYVLNVQDTKNMFQQNVRSGRQRTVWLIHTSSLWLARPFASFDQQAEKNLWCVDGVPDYQLCGVFRLNNKKLLLPFLFKKAELEMYSSEWIGFHCCRELTLEQLQWVVHEGIDFRLSRPGYLGMGSYFASHPLILQEFGRNVSHPLVTYPDFQRVLLGRGCTSDMKEVAVPEDIAPDIQPYRESKRKWITMFACRLLPGKVMHYSKVTGETQALRRPPKGYDSTMLVETSKRLIYLCTYHSAQCVPFAMYVYTKIQ